MNKTKRIDLTFTKYKVDGKGKWHIKCNETNEILKKTWKLKRSEKYLKDAVETELFLRNLNNSTKEEIKKLIEINNGRLRESGKKWTKEEVLAIISLYESPSQLRAKSGRAYTYMIQRKEMKKELYKAFPEYNRRRQYVKYTEKILNPNIAFAKIFSYDNHVEFCKKERGAYDNLRKFGVNTLELMENKEDAKYLKSVILKLANEAVENMVTK